MGVKAMDACARRKRGATLRPGLRTRLRAASRVLVGVEAAAVRVKSCVQGPAGVLAVQVLSRLARALMRGAGELPVAGKVLPGEVPVVFPAREMAMATALARPVALVAEAPRLAPGARNWESAQVEAAVVASLRV